jgi:hypothetical protein
LTGPNFQARRHLHGEILVFGRYSSLTVNLAACGSSATAVPTASQAPAATAAPLAPSTPGAATPPATLTAYAAEHAGGPGAIYLGDINELVGPAATPDQGDADGNVPFDSLQRHLFVYESDYYQGLLEQAKITHPTPLVSTGQNFKIQHACLNRALSFCKVDDTFFFPNVLERTNGQVELQMSSFPELGLGGPDIPDLLASGALDMGTIVGPYVAGTVPALEIQYLFGAFTDREEQFITTAAMAPAIGKLLADSTAGGKVIFKEWASGNDIFFFSKKRLLTLDDFKGQKTRAFGTSISDWIIGMGAEAQFVAFAEVYTALERGILSAGVTGGDAGFGQRW